MEQKISFDIPRTIHLSKYKLYGKIVFWVIFSVLMSEAIFISIFYLIIEDIDLKILDHLVFFIVCGLGISTITSMAVIMAIRWVIFSHNAQIITRSKAEHDILYDLKQAMEKSELSLYYQPQVSLKTGHIVGMETLLRWNHYANGFISPALFIPLAEQSGLIEAIDSWVLEMACMQTKQWLDQGYNLRVAVNLSAMLFKDSTIVDLVAKILQKTKFPAENLELELTETAMVKDIEHAINVMQQLRSLGLIISMDDFGTGYASLSNLDRFPIQKLKIDKSFVHSINQYSDLPNLADSIIEIGHRLNLTILAEGLESEYQKNYFTNLGCDEGQGYYFSEPIPANDFIKLLKQKN